MPVRRDQVVRAALELLDEVGLDGFTTRALTDRLGLQRGALYWHVKSKRELLTAVAALVVAPAFDEGAEDGDWANAMAAFAHRLRAALLAHRDGARLLATHTPFGQGMRHLEARLAKLRALGIPPVTGVRYADTIASYVTGFVLQEQAEPSPLTDLAPGEDLPILREWLASGPPDNAATFTASVATIVTGMRAEAAALANHL
jgi:TetR/AcrR family transcriptional regulator, tetracycline repressor protein